MAYEGFAEYSAKKILEHIVGKTAFTMPTAYVALYVGDPQDGGTEVSGVDYAREETAGSDWGNATFTIPIGSISNVNDIDFGTAGGAWGTVDSVAIFDAATDGNMLITGDIVVPRPIVLNDPVKYPAGTLTLRYIQATIP